MMQTRSRPRETHVDGALAAAIDDAVMRDHQPLIARLIAAALRLPMRSAALHVSIARARARVGELEGALATLDAAPLLTSEARSLRAHILIRLGRAPEAHLDLARLQRAPDAPHDALRLLAMLEAENGRLDEGIALLNELAGRAAEPHTFCCLLLLHLQRGDERAAAGTAARLREFLVFPHLRTEIEVFLLSLGLSAECTSPPKHTVIEVARDLSHAPSVAAWLVGAQREAFDATSARLLLHALIRMTEDGCDDAETHAGIAELLWRLDGPAAASAWLDRAGKRHPMSATLSRLRLNLAEASLHGQSPPADPGVDRTSVIGSIGPHAHLTPHAGEAA